MPLKPGEAVGTAIKELYHHGSSPRSRDQIIAIAESNHRRQHRAFGGANTLGGMSSMAMHKPPAMPRMPSAGASALHMPAMHMPKLASGGFQLNDNPPWQERAEARQLSQDAYHSSGLFQGNGAGRTDRLPRAVGVDSFVMPADTISSLGEGTTAGGANIMNAILSSGGPYGVPAPRPQSIRPLSSGGSSGDGLSHVMVAPGEYLIPREALMNFGFRRRNDNGKYHPPNQKLDLEEGHRWAREFVGRIRKHQMKFLKNAPPPKK